MADSSHLGALELLSRCLWAKQDFAALERVIRRLITLNPYEPGYFGLLGMALRALGRYSEAAEALRRDPASSTHLADLEAFQASLVKDLVEHDATFAAMYAKSPEQATKMKGLDCGAQRTLLIPTSQSKPKAPTIRQYN